MKQSWGALPTPSLPRHLISVHSPLPLWGSSHYRTPSYYLLFLLHYLLFLLHLLFYCVISTFSFDP